MSQSLSLEKIFFGWWIVGAAFTINLYIGGAFILGFTTIFEPIAEEMGWSYVQISLASSLRGLEASLLAPAAGIFVDRWGPRKLIFSGGIFIAVGSYLLSSVQSLIVFYIAYLIIAVGTSCCSQTVLMATAANWFQRKMGLASGIIASGVGFGGIIIPVMVHLIMAYGWRTMMIFISVGTLIIVIPLSTLFRKSPERYGYHPDGDDVTESGINNSIPSLDSSVNVIQAVKCTTFWKIACAFVLQLSVISALAAHIMPYLSSVGVARIRSGLIATLYPIISVAGRLFFGWMGDRFGKKPMMVFGFALIILGLFSLTYASGSGQGLLIPFVIFYGIGYGSTMALRPSLVRDYFGPAHFGTIFGFFMGIAMIGTVLGPTLAGWVYDYRGNYLGVWYIFAGFTFAALIFILIISPITENNEIPRLG